MIQGQNGVESLDSRREIDMSKYNVNDYLEMWNVVVERYKAQDNGNPADLIKSLLGDYSDDLVKETFVAVAQLKAHDGRIYGDNRKWTDSIEVDPVATEYTRENMLFRRGYLDYIHTAHINQLITELRREVDWSNMRR